MSSGVGSSLRGTHQVGVRWKTSSSSTSSAIVVMTCAADAPVPMTPTLLPASEADWSHCAVWKDSPWKSSMPSNSGSRGEERAAR